MQPEEKQPELPNYLVVFLKDGALVGVVSKEGYGQYICTPSDSLDKAKKYGAMVKEITGYKPLIYVRLVQEEEPHAAVS